MGSVAEADIQVHRPRSLTELQALFAAGQPGAFSLMGARHSFGAHFFPRADGAAIDTTALGGSVRWLESAGERRWVRVPGSSTFEALAAATPGFLTRHPPTSDLITLAGALAACTHDSIGFFADQVRRFTLLTPDGQLHECHEGAAGIAGELYRLVPGSFGVLGVILELEINLYAAPKTRAVDISVRRGHYGDDPGLARLSELARAPSAQGAGMYVYGVRGPTVLFEGHVVEASTLRGVPPLPLTDDATTRNVYLQGIASLAPRLTNWFSLFLLRDGRRFRADLYGHAFFQRSYGRALAILGSSRLAARALRGAGLDPRLPVAHQSFVVPVAVVDRFLDAYFDVLATYPDLVPRIEQQDLIRLPTCRWPLHGSFGMPEGAFVLTTSIGVARDLDRARRAALFFGMVAERTFASLGVKTLLLKQTHGDPQLLREMHAQMIQRLVGIKAQVDPKGVLCTRWLDALVDPARA